ncbi:MAG: hypothetical protein ACI906_000683 [Candidatus Latescibacterota bacterium]|jgi:hypothetical protein
MNHDKQINLILAVVYTPVDVAGILPPLHLLHLLHSQPSQTPYPFSSTLLFRLYFHLIGAGWGWQKRSYCCLRSAGPSCNNSFFANPDRLPSRIEQKKPPSLESDGGFKISCIELLVQTPPRRLPLVSTTTTGDGTKVWGCILCMNSN